MRNYRAAEGGRPYISAISVNHFVGDAALGVPKQFLTSWRRFLTAVHIKKFLRIIEADVLKKFFLKLSPRLLILPPYRAHTR